MKHPEVHGGEISNVRFHSFGLEDDKARQDFFRPSLSETQQTRKINKKMKNQELLSDLVSVARFLIAI